MNHVQNIATSMSRLKLEVDEFLQVGRDELIDDKDYHHHDYRHDRKRHIGEPQAISAFKIRWQPMYYHSKYNQEEYVFI